MQNLITALNTRMNKVKRALGLPESVGLFGIVQACPILVFFGLLITAALAVVVLS